MSKIAISEAELDDMIEIANTDLGMMDLLLRAKEYYLLKRKLTPDEVQLRYFRTIIMNTNYSR